MASLRGLVQELFTANRRKIYFSIIPAVIFGLVDILAQASSSYPVSWDNTHLDRLVVAPVVALLILWAMLSLLDWVGELSNKGEKDPNRNIRIAVTFIAPLACWMVQFLHFWPMASMNDTAWILDSPFGAAVQHPLSYNVALATLARTGEFIGGSPLAGVVFAAIVQMLLWAALVGMIIVFLDQLGTKRSAQWLLIAYVSIVPIVGNYTFALVKDAVFSLFVVALIPVLWKIKETRGIGLSQKWFFGFSTIVLLGFAVMRNNGLVVLALVLVFVVIFATQARRLALVLSGTTVVLALLPTMATTIGIGPSQSVEWVGVPLQTIGYTNVHNPTCIPAEARKYFDELIPQKDWVEAWSPNSVDSTKDSRAFNRTFLQNNVGGFAAFWISTAVACPGDVISGYLVHTHDLWRIDATTISGGQSYFTQVVSNRPGNRDQIIQNYAEKGIVNESLIPEPVAEALNAYYREGLQKTPGPGTWLWLAFLLIIGFAYRRRHEWLAVFAPNLLIFATLLAATPATHPFRYTQFIVLVVPIAAVLLLATPRMNALDDDVEEASTKTD